MVRLTLLGERAKLAPANPWGWSYRPLYHQWRTYEALATHDLVVNAYNTGTGKTQASLLHLLRPEMAGRHMLFVAPTNALLHQHVTSITDFVARQGLDRIVIEVTAAHLRRMMEGQRPGETLQRLIENPLTYAEALGADVGAGRRPMALVVNPDIFYYALYFRYGSHDQRNVFQRFLTAFDYIVIDEFHYYDSKQLANFLFFFVISQEFGYFQKGRRICLLSATPNVEVTTYLARVFDDRWTMLTPQNEPSESCDYAMTPVLSELSLEIADREIQDWAAAHADDLAGWLAAGQDGALISSALWRVNTCYDLLRRQLDPAALGRITGPEPAEARARATGVPLILATPTVDIGYNFDKEAKERQNIDFVICDARHGDELVQRLGRAGRLLGKAEQTTPSHAVALLPEEAYRSLAAHDGERLTRADFAALVGDCDALPPRQSLYAYIRSHAITECFYPIYQIRRMMGNDDLRARVDALYERVREVFAPGSQRPAWRLSQLFSKHWHRQQWLRDNRDAVSFGRETARHVADWLVYLSEEVYAPADLAPLLPSLLAHPDQQADLRDFVSLQIALTEALFHFRDAFEGPRAVVYDPQGLLSSQPVAAYGLVHVLSTYAVRWLAGRAAFRKVIGDQPPALSGLTGDVYGVLEGWREPRASVEFAWDSPWPREVFDQRACRQPTALRGLRLMLREQGGDVGYLEPRIAHLMAEDDVPLLGIRPRDAPVVYGKLKGASIYPRRLNITFPDGQLSEEYRVLLGTQAFLVHAELLGYFVMRERLRSDAIIL